MKYSLKEIKVLFYGAYCYNNIGDDLFFYILDRFLYDIFKNNIMLTIITANYLNTYEDTKINNIKYINSKDLWLVIKNIKNTNFLILGPGSIFGDQRKYLTQNMYILFLLLFSKLMNKKRMFLGIDISRTEDILMNWTIYSALLLSDRIFVRFNEEFSYIREKFRLINDNHIMAIHDLVYSKYFFDIISKKNSMDTEFKKNYNKNKIGIVLSDLRHLQNYKYIEKFFVEMIKILINKDLGIEFLFLNNGFNYNDFNYLKYLDKKYNLGINEEKRYKLLTFEKFNPKNIKKVYEKIESYSLVISNKLHSSILCSIAKTPYISLNYHSKMHLLNKELEFKKEYEFDLLSLNNYKTIETQLMRFNEIINNIPIINYNYSNVVQWINENNKFFESLKEYLAEI